MNYVSFCKSFFAATNIPVSLLKNGDVEYSHIAETLSIPAQPFWQIEAPPRNPEFCAISPDLEYGRVRIEGTDYDLIIGPAFNVPATAEVVRQFIRELSIPAEYREAVTEFLYSIPITTHSRFCAILCFLHLCLNQKEISPQDFLLEEEALTERRNQRHTDSIAEELDNNRLHNSYEFEQELYRLVQNGVPEKLKAFLERNTFDVKEGKMAASPLRQAKNIFIGLTTKVGMIGAIPGGLDVERTYQLIDLYSQECERLQRIDDIHRLQYIMLIDFCRRTGEAHIPDGVSAEIFQCASFIRSHINEPISVDDVAAFANRSSSYIMKRFKEELGVQIGAYITQCRLEEAKSLLQYSDKSLAEISLYLCFSSQSYFQNVFKKQYGLTPMQYRKEHQKLTDGSV